MVFTEIDMKKAFEAGQNSMEASVYDIYGRKVTYSIRADVVPTVSFEDFMKIIYSAHKEI